MQNRHLSRAEVLALADNNRQARAMHCLEFHVAMARQGRGRRDVIARMAHVRVATFTRMARLP